MACKAAHYCYDCLEWIPEYQWSTHCAADLKLLSSLRCGVFSFRGCIVIPGRCPFCLGKETLDVKKRMKQWTLQASLLDHVRRHLEKMSPQAECPHPLCSSILYDVSGAWQHLDEHHGLAPHRRSPPKRSLECSEAGNASDEAGPKKLACLASPDNNRPKVEELQWEAVVTLPQAQEEFGSIAGPSADRFYSSRSRIIDGASQSPIQFPFPPLEQSIELPWLADGRSDDDCDSVESFDSLPSLSSLLASSSSSQTTDFCAESYCKPGITKEGFEDGWHDPKHERRRRPNAWSPELEAIPENSSEADFYKFALESVDRVAQRSKSGPTCPKCRTVMPKQSVVDREDNCGKCHGVKVDSMKKEWDRRSYPTINWKTLPERLQTHIPLLLDVLNGRFETPFQQRYQDHMQHLKDYGTATTRSGYYGPRGESLMSVLPNH
jgi:hypothetical protein